jgi:hypothetical protein
MLTAELFGEVCSVAAVVASVVMVASELNWLKTEL